MAYAGHPLGLIGLGAEGRVWGCSLGGPRARGGKAFPNLGSWVFIPSVWAAAALPFLPQQLLAALVGARLWAGGTVKARWREEMRVAKQSLGALVVEHSLPAGTLLSTVPRYLLSLQPCEVRKVTCLG